MKHVIPFILVLGLSNMSCGKSKKEEPVNIEQENQNLGQEQSQSSQPDGVKIEVAVITTEYGDMVVEFFEEAAPKHVESFKLHTKNGYYDGTIFHRVIPGFMIQGGDPNTKGDNKASYGTGGHAAKYYGIGDEENNLSWNLPAEFSDISHNRGILSMARSTDPNSGGSQFFICAANAPHLNGQYTVFGQVVQGEQVIDQIVSLPRDARDNPNRRVAMKVRLEKRDK
ncbi:MAG: peptidylprolyl isomerase [Candidatus Marinimicrobia bacterium]|nr:peptidylprolyl isomerase [Candidatus Neomarinimicrobiota bacterium]